MAHRTQQELRQWAENVSEPGCGHVTQGMTRAIILNRANVEELEQGFTRSEMRTIWQFVNGRD